MNDRVAMIDFQKVDNIIRDKYLSWAELARRASVSSATIFSVKAGRRNASNKTIRKIAAALEVEPSEIIKK